MKLELTGQQFGHVTAVRRSSTDHRKWIGTCDCSPTIEHEFSGSRLGAGKILHCGCLTVKHGHTSKHSRSPTYKTWQSMLGRCRALKVTLPDGTTFSPRLVSKKWLKFQGFLDDMGERPLNKSLDRVNTLGHYTKSNCRWATRQVQDFNKTNTKMHYADPQNRTMAGSALDWAEWYTERTHIPMTVEDFHYIIKFMTPEQMFCAFSDLSTTLQLRKRVLEEKSKAFKKIWVELGDAPPSQDFIARQLEESGYVEEEDIALDTKLNTPRRWNDGDDLAVESFRRMKEKSASNEIFNGEFEYEVEDTGYVPD
jgi:hypothetical protein